MRIRYLTLSILMNALLTSVAAADTPITADEFEARTENRTIGWRYPMGDVGVEYYLPGRVVLWAATPGECSRGVWFEKDELICFLYDGRTEPGCWHAFDRGGKLVVVEAETALTVVEKGDAAPLVCDGPGV